MHFFPRGNVRYVEEFIQAEYCNLHFDTHIFIFTSIENTPVKTMIKILLFQTFEEGYAYITSSIALDQMVREEKNGPQNKIKENARAEETVAIMVLVYPYIVPYPGSKMSKSMSALPQINNFFEKTVVRSLLGIIKMRLPLFI